MDRGYFVNREVHPKNSANIFSLLTFRYIHQLLIKGNRKDLQEDDIYRIWNKFEINKSSDESEKSWYAQKNSKHRSIVKLLISKFLLQYLLLGIAQLLVKILNVIVVPYSLGKVISFFKINQTEITKEEAWYYGVLLVVVNLFSLVYEQQYALYKIEIGLRVCSTLCSLLYRKILRLNPSKRTEISSGKLVSIITKDLTTMEESTFFFNDIWIETVQGVIVFYLLFKKIGSATIVGMACYTITIIIQAIIAKMVYKERYTVNLKSDRRLFLIQEVLSFIRTVKLYTWENFFSQKITYARKKEVKKFGTMTFLKFISIFTGNICDEISFFATILFYIYLGNSLTAEVVYYSEMCFNKLSSILNFVMTSCASVTAEFLASTHRIEAILNSEETEEKFSKSVITPKVDLDNARLFPEDSPIDMKLRYGFHFIFGPMESGKTLLLKSIIGERSICGKINVEGSISYVPQEPWIFPSSVKQNILFGQPYNESRYKEILDICALSLDLKKFIEGDETIIKDCDMNLSRGQQARINIARALYKQSDIYIFDEPLASLDNRVKNHIFHEIRDYLKEKLVLFATNDSKFINEADNLILMFKGGISLIEKPSNISRESGNSKPKSETTQRSPLKEIEDVHENHDENSSLLDSISSKKANIYNEDQKTPTIGWKVYLKYLKFGGGVPIIFVIFFLYTAVEAMSGFSEKILNEWVEKEENSTSLSENIDRIFYLKWYTSLVLISCTLMTLSITAHFIFSLKISINLHKSMIQHIMTSTMNFFDETMAGNIMNRFSKDLFQVDEFLPFVMSGIMLTCTSLFSTATLISSVNIEFTLLTLGLLLIFLVIGKYFLKPARSLKKLENSTRSPLVGYFNATLNGLSIIKAHGTDEILVKEFDKHQELYICSRHLFEITMRCLAFSLNLVSTFYTSLIIVRFLLSEEGESSADVGLAITQSFALSIFFDSGLRLWIFLEALMICFLRTVEYTEINAENEKGETIPNWPKEGCINFENVNLSYKKEKIILKNITCTIQPKEKIGIVGRTGAGKSSLIMTLFRLYDIQGKISIDDHDIKTIPLEILRDSIAIIPQDPLVFSGSIRDNIDPLKKYSDNQIWRSLNHCNLKEHVKNLDDNILDSCFFHSLSHKQLISIARAIVRETKIIVLDEATSNMDDDTGILIKKKLGELFCHCTVIIIAHRLNFVMDCDRVMVMDQGEIVEFDRPGNLLRNRQSLFFTMINDKT